jgi:hypothetical protein
MLAPFKETETPASRVIYINSKDATNTYGGNDSDFDFTLSEPIVVPDHHTILMSVYSAEIPYSFYNFEDGRNTRLDYAITPFGKQANYDANGYLDPGILLAPLILPQGNYTATQLAAYLTANVVTTGPIYPLQVLYDPITMKFKFSSTIANIRITLGLKNGVQTGTAQSPGDDMNEELGFDFEDILGDPFVELNAAGTQWNYGYTNAGLIVPGPGTDILPTPAGPFFVETFLFSDDVVDLTNSIRSLFLRTNLSTSSILDSHIGGGFSNILTRVPINTEPGGIINIQPVNGNVHKLLLKVKSITNIAIRLTNQKNTTINLNGLNFDISLKLDFIETKNLLIPKTLRTELAEFKQEKDQEEIDKLKLTKSTKKKKNK